MERRKDSWALDLYEYSQPATEWGNWVIDYQYNTVAHRAKARISITPRNTFGRLHIHS